MNRWGRTRFVIMVILLTACPILRAVDEPIPADTGVRYARLTSLAGEVYLYQSMSVEEQDARMNYPFLQGDRLITGSDGNAEIQLDDNSAVWLWHDTKFDSSHLGFTADGLGQITGFHLWVGEVYVRFRQPANLDSVRFVTVQDLRIDVPSSALIHLKAESNGTIYIAMIHGEGTLSDETETIDIDAGFSQGFNPSTGSWESLTHSMDGVFDEWVLERDKLLSGAYRQAEYLPEDAPVDTSALDENGRWVYVGYLGTWCWRPYVSIGWRPYHYGSWVWVRGWGWTWIPEEPWGWVPYHYGYWAFYLDMGWVWVPHWRWGPHWCAWYSHGRRVYWVPLHPRDDFSRFGVLKPNTTPRNSQLELGVAVVGSQSIEHMMANHPVEDTLTTDPVPEVIAWNSAPPDQIEPLKNPSLRTRTFEPDQVQATTPRSFPHGVEREKARQFQPNLMPRPGLGPDPAITGKDAGDSTKEIKPSSRQNPPKKKYNLSDMLGKRSTKTKPKVTTQQKNHGVLN